VLCNDVATRGLLERVAEEAQHSTASFERHDNSAAGALHAGHLIQPKPYWIWAGGRDISDDDRMSNTLPAG